jgi:predicted kinase
VTLIVLVCGLPGVGKTSISNELAKLTNWVVLSTDKIRKELISNPIYSKEERRLIYDVLVVIAKYLHSAGINSILDATFNTENSRKEIKNKLNLRSQQICIVECICPEDIVISRLKNRKNDYSDADTSIYKSMKATYQPIEEEHIVVDTSQQSPSMNAAKIISQILLRNKKNYKN